LRHDGVDYHGDCIKQITYLLFLEIADDWGIWLNSPGKRTPRLR